MPANVASIPPHIPRDRVPCPNRRNGNYLLSLTLQIATLLPAVRFPNKLIPYKLQDELPADTYSPLALFWVTAVCMRMGWERMVSSATTPVYLPFSVDAHLMPYAAYSGIGTITQSTALAPAMGYHNKQNFWSSDQLSMHLKFHVKNRLWVVGALQKCQCGLQIFTKQGGTSTCTCKSPCFICGCPTNTTQKAKEETQHLLRQSPLCSLPGCRAATLAQLEWLEEQRQEQGLLSELGRRITFLSQHLWHLPGSWCYQGNVCMTRPRASQTCKQNGAWDLVHWKCLSPAIQYHANFSNEFVSPSSSFLSLFLKSWFDLILKGFKLYKYILGR